MKDYSVFYKKYKQNKYLNKKHNKESEKIRNLKKEIEVTLGNKGAISSNNNNNDISADSMERWNNNNNMNHYNLINEPSTNL